MSRIEEKFRQLRLSSRKAFIPYITAGDPDLEITAELIVELERSGADIIELGVPFSDPMADGPLIQRASERALRRGTTARSCIELVSRVRQKSQIPIVLMSYLNPLLALGLEGLGQRLERAGVDGVIVTDLVPEEAAQLIAQMRPHGIDTIFLVAPTSTDERMKLIAESSSGFIYAVSRTGVTGVREELSEAAAAVVARARRFTDLPVAIGFGISTPEHIKEAWSHADAAVVGSRIVAEIEKYGSDPALLERISQLVRWLIDHKR
jgi:tryptophan synthase alpha chain